MRRQKLKGKRSTLRALSEAQNRTRPDGNGFEDGNPCKLRLGAAADWRMCSTKQTRNASARLRAHAKEMATKLCNAKLSAFNNINRSRLGPPQTCDANVLPGMHQQTMCGISTGAQRISRSAGSAGSPPTTIRKDNAKDQQSQQAAERASRAAPHHA